MMGARRMLLQKVLRGAAAMALTDIKITPERWIGADGGNEAPSQYGLSAKIDDNRHKAARLLERKSDQLYRKRRLLQQAINSMDLDLQALRSTAPQWRAWVMYDREKRTQAVADRIRDKLHAIWETPADKLRELLVGVIDDTELL